jgi:Holliday junction resolvasome RuvABC endonuclease subunit
VAKNEQSNSCVIGIAPSSRGFGYAVMLKGNILVDWGVKAVKSDKKNEQSLAHIAKLVDLYGPRVIALEDFSKNARRSGRIRTLAAEIEERLVSESILIEKLSRHELKTAILQNQHATKHELAENLANRYPEQLAFRVPKKRRLWVGEAYQMDIFDAVALAQCCHRRMSSQWNGNSRMAASE